MRRRFHLPLAALALLLGLLLNAGCSHPTGQKADAESFTGGQSNDPVVTAAFVTIAQSARYVLSNPMAACGCNFNHVICTAMRAMSIAAQQACAAATQKYAAEFVSLLDQPNPVPVVFVSKRPIVPDINGSVAVDFATQTHLDATIQIYAGGNYESSVLLLIAFLSHEITHQFPDGIPDDTSPAAGFPELRGNRYKANAIGYELAGIAYTQGFLAANFDRATLEAELTARVPDPLVRWIDGVYTSVLHRLPTTQEEETWRAKAVVDGMTYLQIAQAIEHTQENYQNILDGWASTYFGAPFSARDMATWSQFLTAGTTTYGLQGMESAMAAIGASSAFWNANGQSYSSVIGALYRDWLNRTGSTSEISGWVNAIQAGAGYGQAIASIASSYERRHYFILDQYTTLLGRTPTADELDAAMTALANGVDFDFVAGLLSGDEFQAGTLTSPPVTE